MAWFKYETDVDDCNHGGLLEIMGVLSAIIFIIGFMFFGMLGEESSAAYERSQTTYQDRQNQILFWKCVSSAELPAQCNAQSFKKSRYYKEMISLNNLLARDSKARQKELKKQLSGITDKTDNVYEKEIKRSITKQLTANIGSEKAKIPFIIGAACSQGMGMGYVCKNMLKAQMVFNGKKVEIKPLPKPERFHGEYIPLGIMAACYLAFGFTLMGRFIAEFGRPSGGLIALMAVFAPVFIPFWTVVGLGALGIVSARGARGSLEKRAEKRAKEKKEKEEARLIGEDLVEQRKEIARLMQEVGESGDNELMEKLKQAKKLVEDEAAWRTAENRQNVKDTVQAVNKETQLKNDVDETLRQAKSHEESRKAID